VSIVYKLTQLQNLCNLILPFFDSLLSKEKYEVFTQFYIIVSFSAMYHLTGPIICPISVLLKKGIFKCSRNSVVIINSMNRTKMQYSAGTEILNEYTLILRPYSFKKHLISEVTVACATCLRAQ